MKDITERDMVPVQSLTAALAKVPRYCSGACQRSDWDRHRLECVAARQEKPRAAPR